MSRKVVRIALALTLALGAFWLYRFQVAHERSIEMRYFFMFVDGPLTDYSFSVTRGLPALKNGERGELPDAIRHSAAAAATAQTLAHEVPAGDMQKRFAYVAPLFAENAALILDWSKNKAASKGQKAAWLDKESEIRGKVLYMLEETRASNINKWKWTQSRLMELNAMIYSLKEAGGGMLDSVPQHDYD